MATDGVWCVCKKLLLPVSTIVLDSDLSDLIKKKSKKLDEFFKSVNSLINSKGGYVAIHASTIDNIDLFHQKVDERLQRMISDFSFYTDIFTLILKDENHILYNVKPRSKFRPYSAFDFKTKTSLNKGKGETSNTQVAHVLAGERYSKKDTSKRGSDVCIDLEYEKEATICRNGWREPLHESATVQVKAIPGSIGNKNLEQYCWEEIKLGEYISAFAKIPEGASVYIGLSEESRWDTKWDSAEGSAGDVLEVSRSQKTEWNVWTEPNTRNPTLFFVARKSSRAHEKEVKTGKIITDGIHINQTDQKQFRDSIYRRIKSSLIYVGASKPPDNPIEVCFHPVTNAPCCDTYVIQIKVEYYSGLCFYSPNGPELYKSTLDPSSSQLTYADVDIEDWLTSFDLSIKGLKDTFERQLPQEKDIKVFKPPHETFFH
ncbi:hypothetical protein V1264_006213 [Littorina saxatilis]|uniref:Uncharacterized protein n=1 Tax=Littorina saxatilis TaxID=31220 RepID=A0AAN9G5I1_9CAEN